MKKQISKEYFTHILLNRLETHDRNSKILRFFRPTFFKKLYRIGENNFVNDILIPHVQTLKIYYEDKSVIKFSSYASVDCLFITDGILNIVLKGKEYKVQTPITSTRGLDKRDNFTALEILDNDLSVATIDHFPSLSTFTNNHKNDYPILLSYYKGKGINSNANNMNDKLITSLTEKDKDNLWQELKDFYKNSSIEIVHKKYNNKESK